jgi:predicted outer membrane repeat protein
LPLHHPLVLSKQLALQFPPGAAIHLSSADHTTLFRIAAQGQVTLSHLLLTQTTADQSLISNQGTLHLDSCQITGNMVSNRVDQNGAIMGDSGTLFNAGTLLITNSLIADNTMTAPQGTGNGGGISNLGTLTLLNSILRHNSASASGGGIYNGQTLTIKDSTIADNHSLAPASFSSGGENPFGGGGVYNLGTATISTTMFSNNTAAGDGGAIYNAGTLPHIAHMGELTLTNTTLTQNQTSGRGGGIFTAPGSALSLMNITFFRNRATSGGALFNFADAQITASTIVANSATHNGGGIAHLQPDPARLGPAASSNQLSLQMAGCLLADNQAPSDAELTITQESRPTLHSQGFNLVRVPSSFVPAATDRLIDQQTPLHLASQLAGPSPQTLDLLKGNPALDLIPPGACAHFSMITDAHGRLRPIGQGCEPGASEYEQQQSG